MRRNDRRRRWQLVALALAVGWPACAAGGGELAWPPISRETKPWTRWWWHGSAVTAADLTEQLERYAKAGLGGVEITPIYGVRGQESRFLNYLSPAWMDALEHALAEAERLDMGVDIATGNGWPFGGPWVTAETACKNRVLKTWELSGGERLEEPVRAVQAPMVRAIGRRLRIEDLKEPIGANDDLQGLALEQVRFEKPLPLVALAARSAAGETVQLTDHVGADGMLNWTAPPGQWTLYAVFQGWHGKMVERAGPGGEGDVIDHFSRDALAAYLRKFDEAFAGRRVGSLRAFFNDSYEVDDAAGNSDWTPRFLKEFQRRRGYDLQDELPALFGKDDAEKNARVLCDYRETISDLLLEEFTQPWHAWAEGHGATTRNQAHGSPGNILDLYAATGIPETEGEDRVKFMSAASAAHVAGKRLASAEAATWLGEHFTSSLADVKRSVDLYFLGGVNHICYHGTPFSPAGEPWPGWLFYAAVHFGPTNSWWPHFHALNEYVTRCQSFLQAGQPDNDVLVYWPIHDRWAQAGRTTLDHADGSMNGSSARRVAEELVEAGYTLDFISDRQLATVRTEGGELRAGGASYRALVVPECNTMPVETLARVVELAEAGARVICDKQLPDSSPGLGDLEGRTARFRELASRLEFESADEGELRGPAIGEGKVWRGDVIECLAAAGVDGETIVQRGLEYIRRRHEDGQVYFLVNRGNEPFAGWTALNAAAKSAAAFDPMSGRKGKAALRRQGDAVEVYLDLAPGESCLVRTFDRAIEGPEFPYVRRAGDPVDIFGPWTIMFPEGDPELPRAVSSAPLSSWTEIEGDAPKRFSGVGKYATYFARPDGDADGWVLNLGVVHESAAVRINGESLGTLISAPYQVFVPADKLRQTRNSLEIDVANLMANRIAAMEQRGETGWKKFYNINFPPRLPENRGRDGLFTAVGWKPRPSGLLGPVTLTPVKHFSPENDATAKQNDGSVGAADGPRQMELLDRGVVAIRTQDGVFVSWRLLASDPGDAAFHVYRRRGELPTEQLTAEPIVKCTHFVDARPAFDGTVRYFVRVVSNGQEQATSGEFVFSRGAPTVPYLAIPITPPFGYRPNDASAGDLDGDGDYELVVHMVGQGRDNSQGGFTTAPVLQAYTLEGKKLWSINLGLNIREGAHYTQFMVYDLDGDGRAEVACKTADGTRDGAGQVIGAAGANHVDWGGRILEGPEYLTVFDGLTGRALATTDYIPPRRRVADWGDSSGNRSDRFLACVAYLDGQRPSLVMCRGYYTRAVLAAWDFRGGRLTHRWTFDSDDGKPGNRAYRGQGNHNIAVADVDGDGRDEIVYGSCVIDDDGRGIYATGLGHGDAMHLADHLPERPGLEVFTANGDGRSPAGIQMRDARTGEQIWGVPCTGRDGTGRACAMDIDPRHVGSEAWGRGEGIDGLYSAAGQQISRRSPRVCNMGAWWDGDLLRELLDGVRVSKWDWEREVETTLLDGWDSGCVANNGSKSNPCLCADIVGDWREEIVATRLDGRELRVFVSTIPTEHRFVTLMHDPVYRLGVAWQNVAYNQPAHASFYLGEGITAVGSTASASAMGRPAAPASR